MTAVVILLLLAVGASAEETGFVNCDLLNVRVSPNTECEIVNRITYGTEFEIIYTDNGWYNIRMQNGITGFVCAQYVVKAPSEIIPSQGDVAAQIALNAHSYIGCRYVYGTAGPNSFDCSGFTSYLYKQFGYSLPRSSTSQGDFGTYVAKDELIVGDIVCFSNRSDRKINHVGIYVGDGNFIHASTSNRGVVLDSLYTNYYINHYVSARRVL